MSVPSASLSNLMANLDVQLPGGVYAAGERANGTTWQIMHGDCRTALTELPPASVNCVITSPPYYWQRDYEVAGQFGLESSIDGFVENLVEAFAALKPALTATTPTCFVTPSRAATTQPWRTPWHPTSGY